MTTQAQMTENLFKNWKDIDKRVKYLRVRKMSESADGNTGGAPTMRREPGTSTGVNIDDVHSEMLKAIKLGNNGTLDPLVTALALMRKIYSNATVDEFGNVVISENTYPDIFKDLLKEISKLERVIGSVITEA